MNGVCTICHKPGIHAHQMGKSNSTVQLESLLASVTETIAAIRAEGNPEKVDLKDMEVLEAITRETLESLAPFEAITPCPP